MYRNVHRLSNVDAAYIAGLIDGEGTVTLSRRHASDRRQLVVSIANTERCLLDFVLSRVGAGKITGKRTSAAHHTVSAVYTVSNRQALALLQQVFPFLRSHKRQRARLVLERYVATIPRNGKYTAAMEQNRTALELEFFAISARAPGFTEKGAPLAG